MSTFQYIPMESAIPCPCTVMSASSVISTNKKERLSSYGRGCGLSYNPRFRQRGTGPSTLTFLPFVSMCCHFVIPSQEDPPRFPQRNHNCKTILLFNIYKLYVRWIILLIKAMFILFHIYLYCSGNVRVFKKQVILTMLCINVSKYKRKTCYFHKEQLT